MAACTSCPTESISRSRTNCIVITLMPNELVEVMSVRPAICPSCCSSGVVTSEARVSGPAPGSWVETWMVGKSISGSEETGSRRKPSHPTRSTAMLSSEVATGRLINGADTLMAVGAARAGAELLLARDYDLLPRFEAGFDKRDTAVDLADPDRAQFDPVFRIHNIGEGSTAVALDGGGRHGVSVPVSIKADANVDELPRPQLALGIGEGSLKPDSAGLNVDAVVHDRERALFPHRLAVRIESGHLDLAFGHRLVDRHEMLLRQREGDRDGLQLRDHDNAACLARANIIPRVDQANAGAPGNRGPYGGVVEFQGGGIDVGLIDLQSRFQLTHQRPLSVDALLGRKLPKPDEAL